MEKNDYVGMAEFYDMLMTTGDYYNYNNLAQELIHLLGEKRHLIELGVGTGLMAEALIRQIPDLMLTGIDFSSVLLKQARERLGKVIQLIEEDVLHMNLGLSFEAAYSSGGVWCLVEMNREEYWLCSHFPEMDDNFQGLRNVARHLKEGGMLFLSTQKNHGDKEFNLPNNTVYRQEIKYLEKRRVDKNYFFIQEDAVVAQDCNRFLLFNVEETESFLNDCGFKFKAISPQKSFFAYQKV